MGNKTSKTDTNSKNREVREISSSLRYHNLKSDVKKIDHTAGRNRTLKQINVGLIDILVADEVLGLFLRMIIQFTLVSQCR